MWIAVDKTLETSNDTIAMSVFQKELKNLIASDKVNKQTEENYMGETACTLTLCQ